MARSGHRPGGGIASRVNVSPSVRTGTGSRGTRPAGVAMFGQMQGTHTTHNKESNYRGEPLHNNRFVPACAIWKLRGFEYRQGRSWHWSNSLWPIRQPRLSRATRSWQSTTQSSTRCHRARVTGDTNGRSKTFRQVNGATYRRQVEELRRRCAHRPPCSAWHRTRTHPYKYP